MKRLTPPLSIKRQHNCLHKSLGSLSKAKEPLIWRFFLGFAAEFALPGCTGRFSAVRKPQMRVFGAEPPPVQPPQGRPGKFRTH